jgi:3-oxoacyl-[acyl-carrier protein] reductase
MSGAGMAPDLNSRNVIVTGAAQGIGKAIALRTLSEGWNVIALDKNETRLAELVAEYAARGGTSALTVCTLDVTQLDQIHDFFQSLTDQSIYPYGLVNNAGIFPGHPFLEYSAEDINLVLSVNLFGPIYMTQHFGRLLAPQKRPGVIVNIASIAGQIGSSDAIYGISKSGLLGLTKTSAMALAPKIRVNAVAPAMVWTELIKSVSEERHEVFRRGELIESPLMPEDISDTVWFLLSDQSKHYTGAVLDINNGFNLR